YRYAEGQSERLPDFLAEMFSLPVDLIVLGDPPPIKPALEATRTVPLVMMISSDPVGAGFIQSLARPGGNLTGTSTLVLRLTGKRLELLKETVPDARRVAVLHNSTNAVGAQEWAETEDAAKELGLELLSLDATSAEEIDAAFNARLAGPVDAIL